MTAKEQTSAEGSRKAIAMAGELGAAVVHIFKFQADRIVELWDMGQPCRKIRRMRTGCFDRRRVTEV